MTTLQGVDPRTGAFVGRPVPETTTRELDLILDLAVSARRTCAASNVEDRAAWLRAVAASLEIGRAMLVELADFETALGELRLNGELNRMIAQLELFVEVIMDGSYQQVIIDDANTHATPPRPGLRRSLRAIGPVGIWAASNFPFAFGVIGGDSVSAIAAGCPVIVKAHPSQPSLSALLGALVADSLSEAGAPPGVFATIHGMPAGEALITDRRLKAASFTGSVQGGRALFDLASRRAEPIPFFGELGSINPVFVTAAAARVRTQELVEGLVTSVSQGVGQFCTKPGLVFVPANTGIAGLVSAAMSSQPAGAMLNCSIKSGFESGADAIAALDGVRMSESSGAVSESGSWVMPRVATTTLDTFMLNMDVLAEECFGPVTVIVEYSDPAGLVDAARALPGSLTATIHGEADDSQDLIFCRALTDVLQDSVGRMIWNGWPTGVAVAWGMQHGGPFPASTNSATTSVGAMAIARWLRPITFQSFPETLMPPSLTGGASRGLIRHNGAPIVMTEGHCTPTPPAEARS